MNANSLKYNPLVLLARHWLEFLRWNFGHRRGAAPHFLKRRVIREYARTYGLTSMVETGTYLGEMVAAQQQVFSEIYSIELADYYFERAAKKFAGQPGIHILKGDSADALPRLLPTLHAPVLFWLDGHYSGGHTARGSHETPIAKELESVLRLSPRPFVILIDDARLFSGEHDYPTVSEIESIVQSADSGLALEIRDDIIRIFPAQK